MIVDGVHSPAPPPLEPRPRPAAPDGATGSFGDLLVGLVRDVEGAQRAAAEASVAYATGATADIALVALTAQRAALAFELLLAVRQRALEAYQTLERLQV
jgi:flagellar hook-basal body complex protein FliE